MQIEHKTEKGTLYFVKVPDKAWDFTLTTKGTPAIYFQTGYLEENKYERVIIDSFGWQLIGLTSDVTEQQAKMMVRQQASKPVLYQNYNGHDGLFLSALDCFKSLMQHLEVYEVNPLGKKTENSDFYWGYLEDLEKWKQSESRTGKWIVLFKPND